MSDLKGDKTAAQYLRDLPEKVQRIVRWVAESYDTVGRWPTSNETIVYCFENDIERANLTSHNEVFKEIHLTGPEEGRTRTGLANWALYDSGACRRPFEAAFAVWRDALEALVRTKEYVVYSMATVRDKWLPDATERELQQIGEIFESSMLSLSRPPEQVWQVTVGMHYLERPVPTVDRILLHRPSKLSDARRAPALGIFRGDSDVGANTLYDEDGRLLRLGKWLVIEPLRGGGQGEVWQVRHVDDAQLGVLKRARRDRSDARRLERVRREGAFLTKLSKLGHPFIVRLLDTSLSDDGDPWLVTEFMPLGSVQEHITVFRGDVGRTLRLARDIALATSIAHDAGILHRDLKPGNVLLRSFESVALTDFGVGFDPTLDALTTTGAEAVRTEWFSPPEARAKSQPTPAWDVYMVGRLIYYVLSGGQYFEGDRPGGDEALSARLARDDLDAAASLVERFAHPNRDKRPQSMAEAVSQLDSASGVASRAAGVRCVRCGVGSYARLGDLATFSPTQLVIRPPGTDVPVNILERGVEWRVCAKCGDIRMTFRDLDSVRRAFKVP
jgi:hypothetical protein